jgi:hypothetical protein
MQQYRRHNGREIELHPALGGSANLALFLQAGDCINERGISPGFAYATSLCGSDNVSSRFFNYAETVEFKLADYSCLS